MPKGKHGGNRSQKSGLAKIQGAGKGSHSEQKKPHVPQKVIRPTGTSTTKSTKKDN